MRGEAEKKLNEALNVAPPESEIKGSIAKDLAELQ